MNSYNNLYLFISLSFLAFNCSDFEDTTELDDKSNISKNKIMPLGASRVEGNRPEYESFRYELWKTLTENEIEFDFIGTEKDNSSYPMYEGKRFDNDHEGRGGWTSEDILNQINGSLEDVDKPDIVLFSSPGGNDALNGMDFDKAIVNIKSIIDILQQNNPNITIIIEQLAPAHSRYMTEDLTAFFKRLQKEILVITNEKTTSSSKVIAIDIYRDFEDSYFADDVHYNSKGAQFVANKYFNTLKTIVE